MRALSYAMLSALILAVISCRDAHEPPVAAGAGVADSADQVFFGAQYVLTTKGIKRGDLTADTAYVLDDQTRFDLRKAHTVFTTEAGAPQGTMDANKGVYSTRTQILEGWGDVVIKMVDGRTLKSPHVVYNQVTQVLSSDTTFVASSTQGTQTGIGFTTKLTGQSFTSIKCLANCGASFKVVIPQK
jgi:LPS export ABC transporter protein LptC